MQKKAKTTIALATGALALAVPGVAQAHHNGGDDAAGAHGNCGGHHGVKHGFHHRGFGHGFGAVVSSTDAGAKTVTVTVGGTRTATRHNGGGDKPYGGSPKSYVLDVSDAKLKVADTNGNGTADEIADIKAGDKVLVKLARHADKGAATVKTKALFDWSSKPATTTKAKKHR